MRSNPDEVIRRERRRGLQGDLYALFRSKINELRSGLNPVHIYYSKFVAPLGIHEQAFKEMIKVLVGSYGPHSQKDWAWIAVPHNKLDQKMWHSYQSYLEQVGLGFEFESEWAYPDPGIASWIASFFPPSTQQFPPNAQSTAYVLAVRPSEYESLNKKQNWLTISAAEAMHPFVSAGHYSVHPSLFWFQELLDEYNLRRKYYYTRVESEHGFESIRSSDQMLIGHGTDAQDELTGTVNELRSRMFHWAGRISPVPSEYSVRHPPQPPGFPAIEMPERQMFDVVDARIYVGLDASGKPAV